MAEHKPEKRVKTQLATESATSGIAEFDTILKGGFPRNRICLLQGPPGSGKTTLALQFLLAGAEQGEKGAYITFSETAAELTQSAKSHGWSLKTISIVDLTKANSAEGFSNRSSIKLTLELDE